MGGPAEKTLEKHVRDQVNVTKRIREVEDLSKTEMVKWAQKGELEVKDLSKRFNDLRIEALTLKKQISEKQCQLLAKRFKHLKKVYAECEVMFRRAQGQSGFENLVQVMENGILEVKQ